VEAAKAQKWGFVTDYVRLKVLYDYGGFYFDTDVEMLKNLDPLREHRFFIGFETNERVNDGQGVGAVARHPIIKMMLEKYQKLSFFTEEGRYNLKESPQYRTEVLLEKGLQLTGRRQQLGDAEIYPVEYFCPKSFQTGRIRVTKNTYSIHHFRGSWHTKKERRYIRITQGLNRLIGERAGSKFVRWLYACNDLIKHKK
jgi:hypothetical protein